MNTQIEYPEITFWNKKARKIDFINPEDFRREKLLKILGLSGSRLQDSFGIAERDEIVKRQRLVRFFIENPNLIKFFLGRDLHVTDLPMDGQDFLDYFNPKKKHNPFWQLVNGFMKKVSMRQEVPQEILSLINFLKETKTDFEAEERKMVDGIAKEVQKATYLEGIIDFEQNLETGKSEVYGYKKYSYGLSERGKKLMVPYRANKKLWRWTGVNSFLKVCCNIYNRINERSFYAPLIIEKIPGSILWAVARFIENKISAQPQLNYSDKVVIKIYFRYSNNGLQIRLLNVLTTMKDNINLDIVDFIKKDFPGYGWRELMKIKKRNKNFTCQADRIRQELYIEFAKSFIAINWLI